MNIKKLEPFLPIIVFLAGMLPILYHLGTLGILEPNEAAICSISRYMVDTNNLSTPILNGIKHFENAPGVYWITAFGIKFFGNNEFGARFFLSVAAGLTAVCIYFIAKLFFGTQCAIISGLLLCTSALFQISFRFLSVTAYCTLFESLLCLCFFYYLNRPSKALRLTYWLVLSIAFMFSGYGVLLPIIALTAVALFTGQKKSISRLYFYWPGILSFIIFGFGWYIIQIIINHGLLKYYLITLPLDSFINNYNGISFFKYLWLPIVAVFPWTTIWWQELKSKIKDFREDPAVAYLVSWAFFPYIVRLFMCSREYSQFMSSLPPFILLTAPAFQYLYFKKDEKSESSMKNVENRRKHNLILAVITSILGMYFSIKGYINFESARVVSQTLIFTGIFWLFSALIMIAFMIKKLNKSVVIPAAMLIPSLILFTVPALHGNEPIDKTSYISSKFKILGSIARMTSSDFICCSRPINSWYFYTGRNYKLLAVEQNLNFATKEGLDLIIADEEQLKNAIKPDTFFVLPRTSREEISGILKRNLDLQAEDGDWIVTTQGNSLKQ